MKTPVLDTAAVARLLEAVRHAEPLLPSHPIFSFLLMQQALRDHPAGAYAELHAVREVLEACFRQVLPSLLVEETPSIRQLQGDFSQENPYLESLSFLYYRYMRPDLALTPENIAELVGFTARSLRRRRQDGYAYLSQVLIEQEVKLRRNQRQALLRARLPAHQGRVLFGRDAHIQQIITLVQATPTLLIGEPGIGKKTLAAAAAHHLLDFVEDLYWLRLDPYIGCRLQVLDAVATQGSFHREEQLAAYFAATPTLLILEGVSELHLSDLSEPLFDHLFLLGISQRYRQGWRGVQLTVPPLAREAAKQLVNAAHGEGGTFDEIYAATGGNPAAILNYGRPLAAESYYASCWNRCTLAEKRLWFFLAYCQPLDTTTLAQLPEFTALKLDELAAAHILQREGPAWSLNPAAAAYLQYIPLSSLHFSEWQETLLQQSPTRGQMLAWLSAFANGIGKLLSPERHQTMMEWLAVWVAQSGLWGKWQAALHSFETVMPDLPYIRCWISLESIRIQRWEGHFAEQLRRLQNLAQQLEQLHFTELLGRTLLEIALLTLYQEDWSLAWESAGDAALYFKEDTRLYEQAQIARIQALLHHNPAAAMQLLPQLGRSQIVCQLYSEAALKLQDYSTAIAYATDALQAAPPNSTEHGRALSLLGRALWHQGALHLALDYQQQAVNVLEYSRDWIGLTRAFNNLGVVYQALEQTAQAQSHWNTALALALKYQDSAALRIIRANLEQQRGGHLL